MLYCTDSNNVWQDAGRGIIYERLQQLKCQDLLQGDKEAQVRQSMFKSLNRFVVSEQAYLLGSLPP